MTEKPKNLNRRRFLKQASVTSAVALGATTNVTAKQTADVQTLSHDVLQGELATHGRGLIQMLRNEGLLASIAALDNPRRSVAHDDTVQIVGETQVDDGFLVVHVEPDDERAFAALWGDEEVTFYYPEDGVKTQDVGTMGHNCWCSDESCSSRYTYQKCYQDGENIYGQCNCM